MEMSELSEESNTLEWKEKTPEVNKILRTVVGFANQFGGRIFIGIKNDGKIVGLSNDEIQFDLEMLSQAIYDGCMPALVTHIYPFSIEDKNVLVIDVSEGMNKPYFVKSLGVQKGTFVRVGRSTLVATPEIINDIKWRSKGQSYDSMPLMQSTSADISESKFAEFQKLLSTNNRAHVGTTGDWQRLKLVNKEGKHEQATVGGLLLFGDSPQTFLSEAKIICTHFKGTSGRDSLAQIECTGTLFEQYNSALSFLEKHIPSSFSIRKSTKKENLLVPRVALREALSNLIVHRDYAMNAPSKIAIFADRIEFFSPGVFPGPFSKRNLESGLTYIRNQTITLFFHKAGIIERLGTGFTTIIKTYREMTDLEPEILEGDGYVKCILPFISQSEKDNFLSEPDKTSKLIRQIFYVKGLVSASDLEAELKISRASANRILLGLIAKGKITKQGSGPKTAYLWNTEI